MREIDEKYNKETHYIACYIVMDAEEKNKAGKGDWECISRRVSVFVNCCTQGIGGPQKALLRMIFFFFFLSKDLKEMREGAIEFLGLEDSK